MAAANSSFHIRQMLKFLRLIDHQPAVKFAGFHRSKREREDNHQDNIRRSSYKSVGRHW